MNITAIWIIDENYILPAYISISSFLHSNKIPITVVYCGEERIEESKSLFTSLNKLISFDEFKCPQEFQNHNHKKEITNRLARIHYAKKSEEGIILLLDADTVFTDQSDKLIQAIEEDFGITESAIYGVLDAKVAFHDFLYFNTKDEHGRDNAVSHFERNDIYAQVFGDKWRYILRGPSINNGVIAFHNCKDAIEEWESFYLKGIHNEKVNTGDDQLPLGAAIEKTSQKVVRLPEFFNSKGEIEGDYIVYHALSSIWKRQIFSAINGESGVSEFAELVKNIIPSVPNYLLNIFIETLDYQEPYLFRQLDGKFGFQHLYEDILSGIEKGNIVEVGIKRGKSTCFMMEFIKNTRKEIQFFVVNEDVENNHLVEPFFNLIDHFDLANYADFINFSQCHSLPTLADDIDFVFLNLENNYEDLIENLRFWYPRLKPGGILAGYDYTSQIGLNYGNKCATYNFCQEKNLSLRISFNIFIIEKPTVSEFSGVKDFGKLVLQELKVKL